MQEREDDSQDLNAARNYGRSGDPNEEVENRDLNAAGDYVL